MDPVAISGLLVGVTSFVGYLVTKTSAMEKAQRSELRGRRKHSLLADQYMFRLETELSKRDITLPPKPKGLDPEEGEDW